MMATQAPPAPFGRHLGRAQRAGRALLDQVLAHEGMTYDTWIALNVIASSQEARREELERTLTTGLDISAISVTQLLGELARYGLVQFVPASGDADEVRVTLTAEGDAEFQRLLSVASQRSALALNGIAPDELQTAIRVLDTFGKQAAALSIG